MRGSGSSGARPAFHLDSATPIEVTRHGRTVGLAVPLPQEPDLSERERLLEAGLLMQAELARLGLTLGTTILIRACLDSGCAP